MTAVRRSFTRRRAERGPTPGTRRSCSYVAELTSTGKCSGCASAHAAFAAVWVLALARRRGLRPLALLAVGYLPAVLVGFAWLPVRLGLAGAASAPVGEGLPAGEATATLLQRAAALLAHAFAPPPV